MQAFRLAKDYGCRPSEIYGVEHPVEAYCFDRAVWYFNVTMEADIQDVTADLKPKQQKRAQERRTALWLEDESTPRQFADPLAMGFGGRRRGSG